MTYKNMRSDERKNHRFATYLSDSEREQFHRSFEKSGFSNFSQYHRHLIIESTSGNAPKTSIVPNVNEVTSYALSETLQLWFTSSAFSNSISRKKKFALTKLIACTFTMRSD